MPESSRPSPGPPASAIVVAPIAPPSASTKAEPAPLPSLKIASSCPVDPSEPLPGGAVARIGTTRMRAAAPAATVVSNTGSIYVVDQVDHRWVLRDVTLGVDLAELPGGRSAVFAPDASFAVVEGTGGRLRFFSVPEGRELGQVDVPLPSKPGPGPARKGLLAVLGTGTQVSKVLVAPGGTTVVVATSDGSVHLVDAAARKLTKTLKLPAKGRLAGVSRDARRAVVEILKNEPGPLESLLSPPALAGYAVLDLKTGATLRKETFKAPAPDRNDPDATPPAPHSKASFRISADGKTVLRLEQHDLAGIDVATGKEEEIGTFGKPPPGSFGFGGGFGMLGAPRERFEVLDEARAVVGSDLIHPTDGTLVKEVGPRFAAISANGQHVATRGGALFELSTGGPDLPPGHDGPVTTVAFLPDNRLVTLASQATFWDTARCEPSLFPARPARFVTTAAREHVTFVIAKEPTLLARGRAPEKVPGSPDLRGAALAPQGDILYTISGGLYQKENVLAALEVPPGDGARRQQRAFPGRIVSVAASPDGALLALSLHSMDETQDPSLHLLAGDGLSTKVEVQVRAAGTAAFAGADRLLHSPEHDGVSVRAVPGLDEIARLHHLHCCERTAVSPDGKLVAGSHRRGLVVWEAGTRRLVARVQRTHREDITALAFSADGRYLATGSRDSTVLFWDVQKLDAPAPPAQAKTWLGGAAQVKTFIEAPRESDFHIRGDGTLGTVSLTSKVKPPPLKAVTKVVSAGDAHCAISEGKVRCWGSSKGGVLGVPEKPGKNRWAPASITAPTTVPVKDPVDVRMSVYRACALERGGDLVCWGRARYSGPGAAPHKVLGGVKAFELAAGRACAVGSDGDVKCWEENDASPASLGAKDAVAVAMGSAHTCLLFKDGTVQCTGENDQDQLGDDTGLDRTGLVAVQGVAGAAALVAGTHSSCALTGNGAVWCWGSVGDMHLGRATRLGALDGATALRIVDASPTAVCGRRGDKLDCVGED